MDNRKVYLDKHTNLLQLEEHMYPLVDVDKPNVFRNLFHYDEIPKVAFNDRIVPHIPGRTTVKSSLQHGTDRQDL